MFLKLLTILTYFQYKINSLLQRRTLRAATLHLLYAGTAKAEENSTRKGCRVTDAMRC